MPTPSLPGDLDLDLAHLFRHPDRTIEGALNGSGYTARIAIPGYRERVRDYFGKAANTQKMPLDFTDFGLVLEFSEAVELAIYDDQYQLAPEIGHLVDRFGPVTFRNAYISESQRARGQRNIFASLKFHYDRGPMHPNRYSLFLRDPFDPVQKFPRQSTTLVMPNAVVYMQSLREGDNEHDFRAQYDLFDQEDVESLVGNILFEQKWDAPEGTGEISLFDNRSVMHASYYSHTPGYPIGVRYLF